MNRFLVLAAAILADLSLGFAQENGGDGVRDRVRELSEALSDDDVDVRRSASEALGNIGPSASAALPALTEALSDADRNVRFNAAYALTKMGEGAEAAIPALIESLEDEFSRVRCFAALSLASIGPAAKAAVPALIDAMEDEDAGVRDFVVWALRAIDGPGSIALFIGALEDTDADVRSSAAQSLEGIGPAAKPAVPALIEALGDENDDVRHAAGRALGNIGSAAVGSLIVAMEHQDADVRRRAASSLGKIVASAKAAVPALIEALRDGDANVRASAAGALGGIGATAKAAVPALIQALTDESADVCDSAASAMGKVGQGIQEGMSNLSQSELRQFTSDLTKARPLVKGIDERAGKQIDRTLSALNAEHRSRLLPQIKKTIQDTVSDWNSRIWKLPWWLVACTGLVVACTGLLVACCVSLLVWPRGILLANESLKHFSDGKVKWPVEKTLSMRHLLVVGFFNHHRWVLDAWVKKRLQTARGNFNKIPSVADRQFHVSVPVMLEGTLVTAFSSEDLRQKFRSKERTCVLIRGQGGAGKTSLACQLGKWAMERDKSKRLNRHPMLPVLIEDELADTALMDAARGKLQELVGQADPIDPEFSIQLVRKKRVLVIVDHLSEMSETTRQKLQPDDAELPAALVVTSRIDEQQLRLRTALQPSLLTGNRVSDFMGSYLAQHNKADLFEDDEQYFDGCRRLSRMVGEWQITVLFAKLYIDQLIQWKEDDLPGGMPENIPDLMLRYLNQLHPKDTDPDVVRRAEADATIAARECLKETYYPAAADRDTVLRQLAGEDASGRLNYLENTLRILRREVTGHDHIRFILDPLAEYLAGLRVVEIYKGNETHWRSFPKRGDNNPLEKIQGFLLAVRDCCMATEANIPDFVPDELGRRGGLDPEMVDRSQRRQRVRRLIRELRLPDAEDRQHAAGALGEIGPDAKEAVRALIEVLKDEGTCCRAAIALGQIGPNAKDAVPALIQVLKDEVTCYFASTALGQIGPDAKEAVPALILALKDEDERLRCLAVQALGEIGPDAKEAVPELIQELKGEVSRRYAVTALGQIGPDAKEAVRALIEVLKDENTYSSCLTVEALGAIGPDAKEAVPALVQALKDGDRHVHGAAAKALGEIGQPAVPALILALKDEDERFRCSAVETLGRIGSDAKKAVPALKESLLSYYNESEDFRRSAAEALERIKSPPTQSDPT